jgi:hypothetical protein
MKRIIRLTESDLINIVKRVVNEQKVTDLPTVPANFIKIYLKNPDKDGFTYYLYKASTGEIFGNGYKDKVVLNYQTNKTKDEVIKYLNKNGIKTK